jgi:ankyrin repeat protein
MFNRFSDLSQKESTDNTYTRFLLAQLLMDSFRDRLTVRDVKSALQKLPQGSDAYDIAYHAAMERIFAQGKGSSEMAKKLLAWILCARRPLSTLEVIHALAVEPGDTEIDEDNILEADQLLTICAGLVTIDEHSDNVRFIHYTTQEYLQRNRELWLPYANVEIARACTAYLSINDLAVGPCTSEEDYDRRLKELVLLDYAAVYWGSHMNSLLKAHCMVGLDKAIHEAQALLRNAKCLGAASQVLFVSEMWRYSQVTIEEKGKGFAGSHWIGKFGLSTLLKVWITERYELDQCDFGGRTPLSFAAESGQEATVKQLLDTGNVDVDSRDNDGRTPLSYAAWSGQEATVKQLLDTGKVDVDLRDNDGWTPLSLAAWKGQEAIVKQLLDTGKVDVDLRDENGRTPLSLAAWSGQEATVKQLLDTGKVDVDSRDNDGRTPLSYAAHSGKEEAAILLLEKLFNHAASKEGIVKWVKQTSVQSIPDFRPDAFGRVPSMWAALGGHLSFIQSLWPSHLSTSCSTIEKKDGLGLSLVHFFAIGNCAGGVSLILNTGRDVNETDSQGWTPLHWAAYFGHKEVLCLLLDREADKNLKDSSGWTAYEISLFVGAEQLNELLAPPLTQKSGNTLGAAQQFGARCDSCQRVSPPQLSTNSPFEFNTDLPKILVGYCHHCRSCNDYDLCFRCILDVAKIHPQHQFNSEEKLM